MMVWLIVAAHAAPAPRTPAPTASPVSAPVSESELARDFRLAAHEFQVPEKILLALAYEASHWQPDVTSAWGGYGLFDFREPEDRSDPVDGSPMGPDIEDAAELLGLSPDTILRDPRQQIRAAAAILAREARRDGGGVAPDPDDLLAWWDAVKAFSGHDSPDRQAMFARYIYELINFGVDGPVGGLSIPPEPVDSWSRYSPPPPTACDYSGCAQFYAADPSNYSDYSRGASDIDYIIIHTVQGSYDGAISWFANPASDVSAHYVVRSSDGAVTQCVKEEDVAWHAGNWDYNLHSVGIEHEGYVEDPGTWYTDAMYQGSAKLAADIAARQSVPVDRDHIIGHYEVPGCPDGSGGGSSCHTDPGSGWDWDYYMSLVSGGEITGNIIGVVADTDIYDSTARLAGATVTIAETGETTTTDADGYYRFYDEPLGTYTMYATMDGYLPGSCTKTISTGDNWCSIALTPDSSSGGGDDTAAPTGDDTAVDTGTNTGPADTGPRWNGPSQGPGMAVPMSEVGGCGCATGGRSLLPGVAWLAVAGLAVGLRRRQQRPASRSSTGR